MAVEFGAFSLDRFVSVARKVRERLLRATAALESKDVPYAIAGDHAVALWVSRVDESAVRNTHDVDILLRRADLELARKALELVGFIHRRVAGVDFFLDGPDAKAKDAIHVIFVNEKVRPEEPVTNPDVDQSESAGEYRVLSLETLVQIKLTAFRDKDRMHLRDLIDVGIIDESWVGRLMPELGTRLKKLLDDPNG